MEIWQKDIIKENLLQLTELTQCTTHLKNVLEANEVITREEHQILSAVGRIHGNINEASKLLEIVSTRAKGYDGLVSALTACGQIGAVNIVNNGFESYCMRQAKKWPNLQIKLNSDHISFKELFPTLSEEDVRTMLQNVTIRHDLMVLCKTSSTILDFDVDAPPERPLYVSRWISNRRCIDTKLFQTRCPDIFVFQRVSRQELLKLVHPFLTRSSSIQLSRITCRHILLEDDDHWDLLQITSEAPMHLICKDDNDFVLVNSTCVTELLLQHCTKDGKNETAYISEDEFVRRSLSSSQPKGAIICDDPGMGKTYIMESLARRFQKLAKRTIVVFIEMSKFSNNLCNAPESSDPKESAVQFLLEYAFQSKFIPHLLVHHGYENSFQIVALMDGFDEIRDVNFLRMVSFLHKLTSNTNIKVIVSSRATMRQILERRFQLVSYHLRPLTSIEQVNFIARSWQQRLQGENSDKFRALATQCVEAIKTIRKKDNPKIFGVPLVCHLLSVVYEKQALQEKHTKKPNTIFINSSGLPVNLAELYERFIDRIIKKTAEKFSDDRTQEFVSYIFWFHTHQALMLLCPEIADIYFREKLFTSSLYYQFDQSVAGILYSTTDRKYEFTHRSFAEFFVAKFFVDFWNNANANQQSFDSVVGAYFLEQVLSTSSTMSNLNLDLVIYDAEAQTNIHEKIATFNFGPTLSFINKMYKSPKTASLNIPATPRLLVCKETLKQNIYEILLACIENKFTSLLQLLQLITAGMFTSSEINNFLEMPELIVESSQGSEYDHSRSGIPVFLRQIVVHGSPEIAEQAWLFFDSSKGNTLVQFCEDFPLEFISPLEVAIDRNDFEQFSFFLEKVQLPWERLMIACFLCKEVRIIDFHSRTQMFQYIMDSYNDQNVSRVRDFSHYMNAICSYKLNNLLLLRNFATTQNVNLKHLSRPNKCNLLKQSIDWSEQDIIDRSIRNYAESSENSVLLRGNKDDQLLDLLLLLFSRSQNATITRTNRMKIKFLTTRNFVFNSQGTEGYVAQKPQCLTLFAN